MSMKSVKNKVHKNGFDLSSRIGFTAKVGEILPVQWKFVYPGETFKFNQASFTRTTPVNTAAYSRVRESFDTFFVPMRLLWDKFPQWVIQTRQPQYAASLTTGAVSDGTLPYLTDADIISYLTQLFNLPNPSPSGATDLNGLSSFSQVWKLLDALGYGSILLNNFTFDNADYPSEPLTIIKPTALNIFPLLCYQKIYSDYFRYQQWENSKPYTFNLDFVLNSGQSHLSISDLGTGNNVNYTDTLFELHYANFPKDYFTGQLPSAQFGDVAIAGPITGHIGTFLDTTSATSGNVYANPNGSFLNTSSSSPIYSVIKTSPVNNTSGISVLAIRQAQALQKWKEITQAAGFDYKSQMKAHWNVNVGNVQSDKCQRVGGFDANIGISEVVNQTLNSDSPAEIAGKGVGSSGSSFTFKNNSNEYGFLMTVYHSVPVLDYGSDVFLERELLKVNPTDFAIPEFDSVGMQETYSSELILHYENVPGGHNMNLDPMGFAPRYAEYKTCRDVVRGGFLRGYKDWVTPLPRTFVRNRVTLSSGSTYNLTYRAFKTSPTLLNPIFLAQVETYSGGSSSMPQSWYDISFANDQLIINFMNSCHAVREFSRDGLPY